MDRGVWVLFLFQKPTVFSKRPFLVNFGGLFENDEEI